VILDIEPNGAFNVRQQRNDAILIFIAPPSLKELEDRLRGRGDTSEEQIRVRQARVAWEMEQSKRYDYVVVNDKVAACAGKILEIIAQEAD
jgi:guanylate kinase